MSKLTKEEFLKELETVKEFFCLCCTCCDEKFEERKTNKIKYNSSTQSIEQLINDNFKGIEDLKNVIEIQKNSLCDNYMIGLYNGLVTAKAIIENTTNYEVAQYFDINKPYKFDELKVGMYCHVFVNTKVSTFNMKVDALITKVCDDERIEFVFVEKNGMVVYKRFPFKENRFYPREVY